MAKKLRRRNHRNPKMWTHRHPWGCKSTFTNTAYLIAVYGGVRGTSENFSERKATKSANLWSSNLAQHLVDESCYFKPLIFEDSRLGQCVASVDRVRIAMKFGFQASKNVDEQNSAGARLNNRICTTRWADVKKYGYYCVEPRKWASYRYEHHFGFGTSMVVLGIGAQNNSKVNWNLGYLEFNPNKICCDDASAQEFREFLIWIGANLKYEVKWAVELKRYDVALDFFADRRKMRLSKDYLHRKYQYISAGDGSITEYLGERNNPGYIKLYDKTREFNASGFAREYERKIPVPVTRCELTASGDWDAETIAAKWPIIHGLTLAFAGKTRDLTSAMVVLMAERMAEGKCIQSILDLFGKKSRPKIRTMVCQPRVTFPEEAVKHCMTCANEWVNILRYGQETPLKTLPAVAPKYTSATEWFKDEDATTES